MKAFVPCAAGTQSARVLSLGLGIIAVSLVIAGMVWSWDRYGWWNHSRYREGTKGGAECVSRWAWSPMIPSTSSAIHSATRPTPIPACMGSRRRTAVQSRFPPTNRKRRAQANTPKTKRPKDWPETCPHHRNFDRSRPGARLGSLPQATCFSFASVGPSFPRPETEPFDPAPYPSTPSFASRSAMRSLPPARTWKTPSPGGTGTKAPDGTAKDGDADGRPAPQFSLRCWLSPVRNQL